MTSIDFNKELKLTHCICSVGKVLEFCLTRPFDTLHVSALLRPLTSEEHKKAASCALKKLEETEPLAIFYDVKNIKAEKTIARIFA